MKNAVNLIFTLALLFSCQSENEIVDSSQQNFPSLDFVERDIASFPTLPVAGGIKGLLGDTKVDWISSGDSSNSIVQGISYIPVDGSISGISDLLPVFYIKNKSSGKEVSILYRGDFNPPIQNSRNLTNCVQNEITKIKKMASFLREGDKRNGSIVISDKSMRTTVDGNANVSNYVVLKSYELFKAKGSFKPALLLKFDVKFINEKGVNIFTGEMTSVYVTTPKNCN